MLLTTRINGAGERDTLDHWSNDLRADETAQSHAGHRTPKRVMVMELRHIMNSGHAHIEPDT